MEHISSHISGEGGRKKERVTERGELMRYFVDRLNRSRRSDGLPPLTMPRMGRILLKIPTKDLYYLRSVCEQAPNFSKKFWWEVDPKKHQGNATPPQPPRRKLPGKKAWKRAPRSRG